MIYNNNNSGSIIGNNNTSNNSNIGYNVNNGSNNIIVDESPAFHTQFADEVEALDTSVGRAAVDISEYEVVAAGIINPFNRKNKPVTTNWVQNLLKRYGIYQNINNLELYQQAFIHTSYTVSYVKEVCIRDNVAIKTNPDGCMLLADTSYERLEFLGDTIIDAIMGSYVYRRFPEGNPGFLTMIKKQLISRWTLSRIAEVCGMGEYMVLSKTLDDKHDGRQDVKRLCDVLEAFVGALYLDFNDDKHGFLASFLSGPGYQVVEKLIIGVLESPGALIDMTGLISDDGDHEAKLRNLLRRWKRTDIVYDNKQDPNTGIWTCLVYTRREMDKNKKYGTHLIPVCSKAGKDSDHREAQRLAAQFALAELTS